MNRIESNVYLIKNLRDLSCDYWLYKVRGLSPNLEDYQKNIRLLTRRLSRLTNSTCAPLRTKDGVFIAQPDSKKSLPSSIDLVRTTVKLEQVPNPRQLNFDQLDDVTASLALRFLYGSIQTRFWNTPRLWQPTSGFPFYNKYPDNRFRELSDEIDLYRGFTTRVLMMPNGEIGVCVDVRSKYVSRNPLPTCITTKTIGKYKGIKCLYEYGNRWYEIKIQGMNDQNASELELITGRTLFEEVHFKAGRNKSPLLRALPRNSSVLIYYNNDGEARNVPSGLCRPTYRTNHPLIKKFHRLTIKAPYLRRREIEYEINKHFRVLEFNGKIIELSRVISYPEKIFIIPDLEFGNNRILSVRNTPASTKSDLHSFPKMKKHLLYSEDAGIYTKDMFDKQFIIMPKSVLDTFGKHVINDIKNEVNRLFSNHDRIKYDPIIIPYNDSVQKSVARVGNEILRVVDDHKIDYGYGLVMIPKIPSKRMIKEDELANLVMRELRKRDLYVSIIHTKISGESYESHEDSEGNAKWKLVPEKRIIGRYKGYIQNVVLNKILLLNEFWPFILKSPLNADLIIGIDVKNNTAGFTIIHKTGEKLSFKCSESEQREQLGKDHIRNMVCKIINEEQRGEKRSIKNIVIHRQGTLFDSEKQGIENALKILSKQSLIDNNYKCTFVEVRTTSRVPFRMFRVSERLGRQENWVENPTIGTYKIVSNNEAFICNTGSPFKFRGTSKPLHILKEGPMPIETVLEDAFYLACLTWTKIDDCSRLPISIKMNDIRLREIAGEYSADALRFNEKEE